MAFQEKELCEKNVITYLTSSDVFTVSKCLSDIKTFSLDTMKMKKLAKLGALDIIISYLENPKMCVLTISIVGNCCLDPYLREVVIKNNGVLPLVRLIKNYPNDEIVSRACRALGNIALSDRGLAVIQKSFSIASITNVLSSTTNVIVQQAALRFLRILGRKKMCDNVLFNEKVFITVSKFLVSENVNVSRCAVKTMTVLTERVSESYILKIEKSEVLGALQKLYYHSDEKISEYALTCLANLAQNEDFINKYVLEVLIDAAKSNTLHKKVHLAVLALCSCSVKCSSWYYMNRLGGLTVLLNILKNRGYKTIHQKVLQALSILCSRVTEIGTFQELKIIPVVMDCLKCLLESSDVNHSIDFPKLNRFKALRGTAEEKIELSHSVSNENKSNKAWRLKSAATVSYFKSGSENSKTSCSSLPQIFPDFKSSYPWNQNFLEIPSSECIEAEPKFHSDSFTSNSHLPDETAYSKSKVTSSHASTPSVFCENFSDIDESVEVFSKPSTENMSMHSKNPQKRFRDNFHMSSELFLSTNVSFPPVQEKLKSDALVCPTSANEFQLPLPLDADWSRESCSEELDTCKSLSARSESRKITKRKASDGSRESDNLSTSALENSKCTGKKCQSRYDIFTFKQRGTENHLFTILNHIFKLMKPQSNAKILEDVEFSVLMKYLMSFPCPNPRAIQLLDILVCNRSFFEKLIIKDFFGDMDKIVITAHSPQSCSHCSKLESVKSELISSGRKIAESSFGVGILQHILLTSNCDFRLHCLYAISKLIRDKKSFYKLLVEVGGLSMILDFLKTDNNSLFEDSAIILSMISGALSEKVRQESLSEIPNSAESWSTYCQYQNCSFDVKFTLDDGCIVSGTRSALSKASEYFRCLLSDTYVESSQESINIPCISSKAFSVIMHMVHGCDKQNCSTIKNMAVSEATEVMAACGRFLLEMLKTDIEMFIMQNIELDEAAEIYIQAKLHCSDFSDFVLSFILQQGLSEKKIYFKCLQKLLCFDQENFLKHVTLLIEKWCWFI